MADHFIDLCKHGRVVSRCRCVGPKVERIVPCVARECLNEKPTYEPKHARSR